MASAADAGLHRFLLGSGEQPGFSVAGAPHVWTNPAAWLGTSYAKFAGPADVKLLRRAGFRATVWESLRGRRGAQGFSMVVALRRRRGADAVARMLLRLGELQAAGLPVRSIRVPGVPSARGFTVRADGAAVVNIFWADGRCAMASGLALPNAGRRTTAAIARPVLAGIRSQRRRTAGRCP